MTTKQFAVSLLLMAAMALAILILAVFHWRGTTPTEPITTPVEPESTYTVIRAVVEPMPMREPLQVQDVSDAEPVEVEPAYTEEELEYMAIVIYREAGSDSINDETRIMVGNVVMNRVADERFPDTIYDVLTQKRQYGRFHWTGIVWPTRAANEPDAVERAYDCARRVLEGEKLLPDTAVWQAEFRQGKVIEAFQDGLYFCS